MAHFVGLDVSKQKTSVCVVDGDGIVVKQGVVDTDPAAIVDYLRGERRRYRRIGLESIGFAPWLYEGLAKAGLPVICIEARHAHGVLKARLNKTDRNDARGIAELMRVGIYKAVHVKTLESQQSKLLLTTRRAIKRKQRDVDNLIRSALLQHGAKLAAGALRSFERRAAEGAASNPLLNQIVTLLLDVRTFLAAKVEILETQIGERVRRDPVCQRFLTVPGVEPRSRRWPFAQRSTFPSDSPNFRATLACTLGSRRDPSIRALSDGKAISRSVAMRRLARPCFKRRDLF